PAVAPQAPPIVRRNGSAHGLAEVSVDVVGEVAQSLPRRRVHPRWIPVEPGSPNASASLRARRAPARVELAPARPRERRPPPRAARASSPPPLVGAPARALSALQTH